MEITGRAKTSVYECIRDIPLSANRIRRFRNISSNRIKQYPLSRKGKSVRAFRTFEQWSPDMASLVAHFLFDGALTHGSSMYNNRSRVLIQRVETLMRQIYDFEPKHWQNPVTGVRRISYHNVALRAYLQEKGKDLLASIRHASPLCKVAFLKAFFDDEGCMDFRPAVNRRSVRGYQKNRDTLMLVRDLLKDVGIEARVVVPNEVVIVGKRNLTAFAAEINFSAGVYVNGKRSNSRWKKTLEKRELLARAIASFKN